MSVQVSYKKQVVLGFFLIVMLFSVLEGISQILWYNIQNACELENRYYEDSSLDFRKKLCFDYKNIKYTTDVIRRNAPNQNLNTISINSHGFRGPEISQDKSGGEYRVIMVGGSTTFGVGATNDASTIPALLEDKLQDKFGPKIQVINAGVIAARSAEEVFYVKNDLIKFKPDLIIVFDGYNDAFNINLSEYDANSIYDSADDDSLTVSGMIKKYFKFLALPNVIYQYTHDSMQISYLTEDVKKQNTAAWINRWNEICQLEYTDGFKLLVTLQPMIGTSDRKLPPIEEGMFKQHKTQKTLEFLNDLGSSLDQLQCGSADLRHSFDGINKQVFVSPVHTGDFANEIIAEKLYEKTLSIISQDLLLDK
jgi:hypothetical protein